MHLIDTSFKSPLILNNFPVSPFVTMQVHATCFAECPSMCICLVVSL